MPNESASRLHSDFGSVSPFRSIAIAGVGLIGGSIALGVRERWPEVRVIGIDRPAVQAHALGSGALDRAVSRLADAGEVDLVILAAPVRQNLALLAEAAAQCAPTTVITDVGGTKRDIVRAARSIPNPDRFVGGHPIGGAERGGFGFARPDLFAGRPWIFTPDAGATSPALERLSALAAGLGARPSIVDAEHHDRLMAYLSHLPQLAASALMRVVGEGTGPEDLRLAGRGLVDTTRLASSPPDVWRDICAVNADAIGIALDELIAVLTTLRAGLDQVATIDALFDAAARSRADLLSTKDPPSR
jgi:prephenate dehydrogenase